MSRILIVEDMAVSREATARLLPESQGHQTDTAYNGAGSLCV